MSVMRITGEKACPTVAKDICPLLFPSPQTVFLITPTAAMLWPLAINKDLSWFAILTVQG